MIFNDSGRRFMSRSCLLRDFLAESVHQNAHAGDVHPTVRQNMSASGLGAAFRGVGGQVVDLEGVPIHERIQRNIMESFYCF